MKRNYYYLVAGLPDLLIGSGAKGFDYVTVRDEILEELHEDDQALLEWLNYSFDNANALALLENRDDFDERAIFSKEDLSLEIHNPETVPNYLADFLMELKDQSEVPKNLSTPLYTSYYHALSTKGSWFQNWSNFQVTLGNIVAATSARRLGMSTEESVLAIGEEVDQIIRSSAADFGLAGNMPWLDQLIASYGDNTKLEEVIDTLTWDFVDELSEGNIFSVEAILSFMVKLNSVERWMRLDKERGAARLDELMAELKSAMPNTTKQ